MVFLYEWKETVVKEAYLTTFASMCWRGMVELGMELLFVVVVALLSAVVATLQAGAWYS